MKILIVGSSGFIGSRLAAALETAGHAVDRAARSELDFTRIDPAAWRRRVAAHDVAINAAGLIREAGAQSFDAVHVRGPMALFDACAAEGVAVVQLSALGADEHAAGAFQRTKKSADDHLLALDVPSLVLQPSLVYGEGGASARLFTMMATLPLIPLPGEGTQQVQPVHVDDLVGAVVATVEKRAFTRERVAIVGPEPLGLRELLARLRLGLGLGRARFLRIPVPMVRLAARLGVGLLDSDTLAMLERGNVASVAPTVALLGHAPRPVARFIAAPMRVALRRDAALEWLLPLLRVSIAVVWLTAGIVSVGPYPVDESLALLARTGITGALAPAALFGAAALDFVLGVATLALPRRRLLWMVQIAVIVVYTAIITVALPEQWLHPYGPVVKNLPMLAAIVLLLRLEER